MLDENITRLQKMAQQLRIDILDSVFNAQSGHIGGSFSCAEIVAYLYFYKMNIDPENPEWNERDRFVLSKGHAAPVLYSALAERGFFDKSKLKTLRRVHSILQGHPDMNKTPGVDMSTGSLGQGFSSALGMAMGLKMQKSSSRVYTILGDGEIEEGEIWESAMAEPNFYLNNLTAFLDYNRVQLDGTTSEIMHNAPVVDKFASFNWNVVEIDGHDIAQIHRAVQEAEVVTNMPTMIIANTIKGKGVSFMENKAAWHGKAPNKEQYEFAKKELLNIL